MVEKSYIFCRAGEREVKRRLLLLKRQEIATAATFPAKYLCSRNTLAAPAGVTTRPISSFIDRLGSVGKRSLLADCVAADVNKRK